MIEVLSDLVDIESILYNCKESFFEQSYNNSVFIKRMANKICQYGNFAVFVEDEAVQGFVAYYTNDNESMNGFISMIVVKEEYQGKGIGTCLLEFCQKDSMNKGMCTLALEVDKLNNSAIGFYNKHGFIVENEGIKTYVLRKNIRG